MQNARPGSPRFAAALLCGVLAAACSNELPYRWSDPARGLTVHSDYTEAVTRHVFEQELQKPMDALQRLFGVDDLGGLEISMHNKSNYEMRKDVNIAGWHKSGEIHVMAGWAGMEFGFPSISSKSTVLHELVHALVDRSELELPLWFEEGLCEVLSESVPLDGELLWLPNDGRERAVRKMLVDGALLSAEELLSYDDSYPEEAAKMHALYAQGTSFVWFLIADSQPGDRGAIAAVAGREDLAQRFAAWRAALPETPVSRLFLPFLDDERAAVRNVAVDAMTTLGEDPGLWAAATRLLADPERSVRTSIRVDAICTPDTHELAKRHYDDWAASDDDNLRLAGQLALALQGDRECALTFCRTLPTEDGEWCLPMLWLAMALPGQGKYSKRLIGLDADVRSVASEVADWIEAQGDKLSWRKGRYRLAK